MFFSEREAKLPGVVFDLVPRQHIFECPAVTAAAHGASQGHPENKARDEEVSGPKNGLVAMF